MLAREGDLVLRRGQLLLELEDQKTAVADSLRKRATATIKSARRRLSQLQPDVQYVFNPGGGILNPPDGTQIRNELVLGMRTNVLF